jgi:hypothetical protein
MSDTRSSVPPPPAPARRPEVLEKEYREIGGQTIFANRFLVQSYPDGAVRVVFAEQFTAMLDQSPAFRGAYYMDRGSAIHLLSLLAQSIGMGLVPLTPPPTPKA